MKHHIIIILILFICVCNTTPEKEIKGSALKVIGRKTVNNGNFSKGKSNWKFWTENSAQGNFTIQNGEACIHIKRPGSREWAIVLRQTGFKLMKHHKYTLSFAARSDQPKRIYVSMGMKDQPYYRYSGEHFFTLTGKMKKYTVTFTMWQQTDPDTCVQFYLGRSGKKTVWIDNVNLKYLGKQSPLIIPKRFPKPRTVKIRRGIQFGLQLASPYEGAWAPELKELFFDIIKKDGRFDHIRIPVWWEFHASKKTPYKIDPDFMQRADWAVSHSLKRGFPTILNMHWFRAFEKDPVTYKDQFLATWRQIAEKFRNYPDHLYFDIFNEPNGMLNKYWNEYFPGVYDIIRETSKTRPIIISSTHWASMEHLPELQLPERIKNDPNVLIQFHPYYPSDFCFQGSIGNGSQFEDMSRVRWKGTEKEKEVIRKHFDAMQKWARKYNLTLYNGEFCAHAFGESLREDRLRWVRFIVSECENRGIPWNYYDFTERGCCVYDLGRQQWDQELMKALFSAK